MTLCKRGLHDLDDPVNARVRSDGKRQCRPCNLQVCAEYHAANRERRNAQIRVWREINAESQRAKSAERRARNKRECFDAYGGVCYCCGETELVFLTLDHLNDDGAEQRRAGQPMGTRLHVWLRLRGYPQDLGLAVACFNCNSGRAVNGGVCPHRENFPSMDDDYQEVYS